MWASLNVTLDPEEKSRLMDGTLTAFKCGACGHTAQVVYSLLYHDMRQTTAIWLIPPGPDGKPGEAPDLAAMTFGKNYRTRIVDSYNQLREKILIFDAGFDDRIIEVAKLMTKAHWEKDHPALGANLFFAGCSGEGDAATMDFVILSEKGQTGASVSRDKMYNLLSKEFAPRLAASPRPWSRVDERFAFELLEAGSAHSTAQPGAQQTIGKKKWWWPFGG